MQRSHLNFEEATSAPQKERVLVADYIINRTMYQWVHGYMELARKNELRLDQYWLELSNETILKPFLRDQPEGSAESKNYFKF